MRVLLASVVLCAASACTIVPVADPTGVYRAPIIYTYTPPVVVYHSPPPVIYPGPGFLFHYHRGYGWKRGWRH